MRHFLLLLLALGGCETADDTREVMDRYLGQPVQSIVSRIGFPQAESTVMGRKAYSWNRTTQDSVTTPSRTTAMVGNTTVTATTYSTETYSMNCTLRVLVDGSDRITAYDLNGQAGACRSIGARLR